MGGHPAFKGLLEIMSAETTIIAAIHNIKEMAQAVGRIAQIDEHAPPPFEDKPNHFPKNIPHRGLYKRAGLTIINSAGKPRKSEDLS